MKNQVDLRKHFAFVLMATVILSFGCFLHSSAQGNWLEKGSNLLKGVTQQSSGNKGLSNVEVGAGLKEALRVGTENVVNQLGVLDGFNLDPNIHIPLPDSLNTVKKVLDKAGMAGMLNDLELRLNRAAELAVPKARALFGEAISAMTFTDVMNIFNGPDDAATSYFQEKMTPELVREMHPIVESALNEAGAIQVYDQVMNKYKAIPFVPNVKADLTDYTVEKGLDGMFYYVAEEEAAIRSNPAARTTDLLKRSLDEKFEARNSTFDFDANKSQKTFKLEEPSPVLRRRYPCLHRKARKYDVLSAHKNSPNGE